MINRGKSYQAGLKPMNFALTVRPQRLLLPVEYRHRFQLLAPYTRDIREVSQVVKSLRKAFADQHRQGAKQRHPSVRWGTKWSCLRWHAEVKSADARGGPAARTRGLLKRRELRIVGVIYTGRSPTGTRRSEHGMIAELDDVRTVSLPPRQDRWRRAAVPFLARIPTARVAGAARVSPRMANFYRSGRKCPGTDSSRQLLPLLRAEARRMLKRQQSSVESRTASIRFLEAFR